MRRSRSVPLALAVILSAGALVGVSLAGSAAASGDGRTGRVEFRGRGAPLRTIAETTTRRLPGGAVAERVEANLELIEQLEQLEGEEGGEFPAPGDLPRADNLRQDLTAPDVLTSWEGVNSFHNDWSFNGNQFSVEPPDQGLCAGNGFVFESVNQVIQVYDEAGTPLLFGTPFFPEAGPVGLALNEFYGFPPAIDFTTGTFGPFSFDVACYYDASVQRWFHIMASIEQDPVTGEFTGDNSLELAVSKSADPTGSWFFYSIPAQNNGTEGTPDHACDGGFCFGDFPKIGADAHGVYLQTNEYSFFGSDYNGAQIYALSKAHLIAGDPAPTMVHLDDLPVPELGQQSFTVWPAQSRPDSFELANGGTEYFVSSTAGDGTETGNPTGRSDKIVVWALTNTSSLDSDAPALEVSRAIVTTLEYVFPPLSFLRRGGPTPILDCINLGAECPAFALPEPPFQQEGPYPLDSSDTRTLSAWFQDGILWTTLGTAVRGRGGSSYDPADNFAPSVLPDRKAGIGYFGFAPSWEGGALSAEVAQQGYIGARNGNLIYPSIAIGEGNTGFIGATLMGPDHFARPVYVKVGLGIDPTTIGVVTRGAGPNDGFTGTWLGDFRPRWGDYSYLAVGDDGTIWMATEYTASRCKLSEFAADVTCGFTRGIFENWSTRVVQLQP